MSPVRSGGPPRRIGWSRLQSWAVVGFLVVLPLPLALGFGWFGLNPVTAERNAPVGSLAHELLNSFPDDRLLVEIASAPGAAPPAASVSLLWARMNETVQKASIQFVFETVSVPTASFTADGLFSIEEGVRQSWPAVGEMALFYLCLHGSYADQSGVLGLAYRGSSIAVFSDTIASTAGGGDPTAITSTVLIHEFGHELGLVGLVGTAPNEDPAHPGHSTDPNDVMYYAVETSGGLGSLFGGTPPPTQFGAADLADLGTVRNTPIPLELIPPVVLTLCWIAAGAAVVVVRRAALRS
ncbi:MAG: hypothetical protein L3K18_02220 [Thermoplasmata archaeon]|nr:hypothetical protein [Thermoplasmata archaeon]MCI4355946.1 hypothetical protein [Thermoplasmata archaeon]